MCQMVRKKLMPRVVGLRLFRIPTVLRMQWIWIFLSIRRSQRTNFQGTHFFHPGISTTIHRFWLWIRQQEEVRQVAVGDGSVNPPSLLPLQSKTTFVWRCHPFHCYKMFCHITIYFNTPLTTYALFAKHSPFVTWGFQWSIPTFSPLSCPWMWQVETLLFLHLWTCLQIQPKSIHAPKP